MARLSTLIFLGIAVLTTGVQGQWNPNFVAGRSTLVHLFEWRWDDIAAECERFLGPYGYGGVQVSPPNENAIITSPFRPWWERYQPVSYNLETRSGNHSQFESMVRRCNNVGVRIYVDAIINHMTYNDIGPGQGTGGSWYNGWTREYEGVPYSPGDFNDFRCPTASGQIEDYSDPIQARYCELGKLRDLNQETEYVREKIVGYMNKLIDLGVAGFRIDAAKHIHPDDLEVIFNRLNNLPTSHGFPAGSRAFVIMEVIEFGNIEPIMAEHFFHLGVVTEFKYGSHLGAIFRGYDSAQYLENWGEGWAMFPRFNSLVFIDNHDNQRGHGAGGPMIMTFRDAKIYKQASAFMLAHPYGTTRVMSSYYWEQNFQGGVDTNDWVGPPNTNGVTNPVPINDDGITCGGGWMCEHRWRQIYNMVRFRNVVQGTEMTNFWTNHSEQIAFCRGNRGFIAINNDPRPLSETLQTCLPAGNYCDVITGNLIDGRCTGKIITVDGSGLTNLFISDAEEDPTVAIHIEARL